MAKATALAQTGRLHEARACIAHALTMKPGDPQLERAREMFSR